MRQHADRTEKFRPLGVFPRVTKVPPVADSGQPYLHIGPCGGRRKRACALDDRARALSGRPFDVAIDQQVRHPVSTLRALWPVSVLGARCSATTPSIRSIRRQRDENRGAAKLKKRDPESLGPLFRGNLRKIVTPQSALAALGSGRGHTYFVAIGEGGRNTLRASE